MSDPLSSKPMTVILNAIVRAPIDDVFGYFDLVENTATASEHAIRADVVDVQPDGRRTWDVVMVAGAKQWTQSIEQVVRERPLRLTTRSWSWTRDRQQPVLTLITDRRFSSEPGGTRVDATIDYQLVRPWRHPFLATVNWLRRGSAQREFERQLSVIVQRIEARRVT